MPALRNLQDTQESKGRVMNPVAKTNDPSTSWDAGETFKAKGKHLYHYQLIASVMSPDAILTSAEISLLTPDLDRYQIARRLPEMEQENIVERCDKTWCSVVDSNCVGWRLK